MEASMTYVQSPVESAKEATGESDVAEAEQTGSCDCGDMSCVCVNDATHEQIRQLSMSRAY